MPPSFHLVCTCLPTTLSTAQTLIWRLVAGEDSAGCTAKPDYSGVFRFRPLDSQQIRLLIQRDTRFSRGRRAVSVAFEEGASAGRSKLGPKPSRFPCRFLYSRRHFWEIWSFLVDFAGHIVIVRLPVPDLSSKNQPAFCCNVVVTPTVG